MELDKDGLRVVSTEEILSAYGRTDLLPIHIQKDYCKNLKTNLLVPSTNQSYSTAVEYITKWFYNKFKDGFFKHTYLEATHMFHEFRRLKKKELLNIPKPACVISASLDNSYDRERLDLYNLGANLYNNRCSFRDAFFIDRDRHLFVSLAFELLLINFSFRMRFATKATQIDVAKMCQLAFRAGGSQKHYLDIDFKVPEELLEQLAIDLGFGVNACHKIIDTAEFLHYINMRSRLMFYYKFNAATGNMEYFLKIPSNVVHIKTNEVSIDDGSMHGMLSTNYEVRFDCQVRFPSIKFFAYYCMKVRESIECKARLDASSFLVTISNFAKIPSKNDRGWQWNLQSEYDFNDPKDEEKIRNKELMSIQFDSLVGDLRTVIDYTKSIAISPEAFLDIRVYNGFKFVPISIDWRTYTMKFLTPIDSIKCYIIVYMDNEYFHNIISAVKKYKETRVQPSDIILEKMHNTDKAKNTGKVKIQP